jgi:DNA processing protein
MENIRPWLALKHVPGLGNHLYKILIERFETPERVFQATQKELLSIEGFPSRVAQAIPAGPSASAVNAELARIQKHGCRIIPINHAEYPPLLREIHDPPPFLYVMGRLDASIPCIAMVGSREATRYGISMAGRLAAEAAKLGLAVVSGLARGIDTACHKGALSVGAQTVAVLGCGLSVVYPPENRRLYERIASTGAVVSELPLNEAPNAYNFPRRNRIIAGMSIGTVVVEAGSRSGSLITARLAAEQGREVFAVPGSINSKTSQGTHSLLKQGAKLVASAGDIVEEFPYLFLKSDPNRGNEHSVAAGRNLTGEEARVYEALEAYPLHIDELACTLDMPVSRLSAVLVNLELKGLVCRSPGMYFSTNGDGL